MQKLLQLMPRLPVPADDGGKIGILGILRAYLGRGMQVRVGSFDEEATAPAFEREMGKALDGWFVEPIPATHTLVSKAMVAFGLQSYVASKYYSRTFEASVLNQVRTWRPEIVHLDHSHMGRYGLAIKREFPRQQVYLRAHNIESLIWLRRAEVAGNPLARAIYRRQAALTRKLESRLFDRLDGVIAISAVEAAHVRELSPGARVFEMPAGAELQSASPVRAGAISDPRLCFVGSLEYTANVDGLGWFVANVWPAIRRRFPAATLTVAGRSSSPVAFLAAQAGVRYLGFVQDVATVTDEADVAVVPLRIGGGMRLKVLDFLSRGVPIIATAVGAEGIPSTFGDREVYRIADTPDEFCSQLAELCASPVLRQHMAAAGRALISSCYSWSSLVDGACAWFDGQAGA